jgi:hypothetical protein
MAVGLLEGNVQNKCASFSTTTFGKNLAALSFSTAGIFHEIVRR